MSRGPINVRLSVWPRSTLVRQSRKTNQVELTDGCSFRASQGQDADKIPQGPQQGRQGRDEHEAIKAAPKLGKLPEWNLTDLYASIDAPEIARDLDQVDRECTAFETAYKGKLATEVAKDGGGEWLTAAVKRYEAIDDVMGRLSSYAGLVHAGNTVDPKISKFYGDVSERLTAASVHLLFFTLELNRLDDAVLQRAMQTPSLGHYRPWLRRHPQGQAARARRPHRAAVPGKVADRPRRLNRLFDQTIASLRFKVGRQGARDRADA